MDNLSFGLTMTVVGVGGTFLTLWILSLVVDLLKKVFPLNGRERRPQRLGVQTICAPAPLKSPLRCI
jgi:Na+-transporting methylmalonyl-CoA/oxaloacetate decarboxylase gamma subunit